MKRRNKVKSRKGIYSWKSIYYWKSSYGGLLRPFMKPMKPMKYRNLRLLPECLTLLIQASASAAPRHSICLISAAHIPMNFLSFMNFISPISSSNQLKHIFRLALFFHEVQGIISEIKHPLIHEFHEI
jgi:hypothetical protein